MPKRYDTAFDDGIVSRDIARNGGAAPKEYIAGRIAALKGERWRGSSQRTDLPKCHSLSNESDRRARIAAYEKALG